MRGGPGIRLIDLPMVLSVHTQWYRCDVVMEMTAAEFGNAGDHPSLEVRSAKMTALSRQFNQTLFCKLIALGVLGLCNAIAKQEKPIPASQIHFAALVLAV